MGKWVYGNQQQNDNALTARIIAQIGDQITQALLTKAAMKQKEGSYKQAASDNLTKFVGMTADERQQFLNSPGGIQQVTEMVDPHLYSKHDTGKEGFAKPSYEGILGMGAETEPERAIRGGKEAQAAKFGFEANKAALELNEKMDQMKFQSEFFDMGKKFEAGGEDAPTPKEYMGAALRAGYKEALSNPMSLLDPGSLVKQEEQKVVGSDAWKKLKGAEMLTELQKQRPVHNQEQADQMVNLGKYLGGDTSAVVDWTKINPDWRDAENDLKKQQLDVQKQELWRNTLKDTSDLYTTIVTNGVPAKDAERFLDEFQKTGRPPKDIPWPQDKIKVLQAQVEQANLNKMTIEAKHAEQELPEFKQALDLWRATASDDVKGQARAAKQAWDLFYKMHPEYKGMPQPGFWDKMLGFMKGTGNYAQGAAGVAGATASDAAAGIAGQRTPDSVWPMGQDIMNVSRAVGGGLTAAGNYVDSAVKEVGAGAANAAVSAAGYAIPGAKQFTDKGRAAFGTLADAFKAAGEKPSDIQAPGFHPPTKTGKVAETHPELARMKETLKAQLKEIGKRQSSMSVQEQTYWYDIAKNLDAAKDDPAALAALFVQINMGSGAK